MKNIPCHTALFIALISTTLVFPRLSAAQEKPGRLTVAAYNVEFMLDVFDDPYSKDEAHAPKARKDIEMVAKAIRELNPDVITLEEVENEGIIREMIREFLPDMDYEYVAANTTNSERGQNLGIISRKPILSLTSHRFLTLKLEGEEKEWRFGRDLWKVRIQATPTRVVDLFVVHLKSRLDSPDDTNSVKWRLAEAKAVRKIIGEAMAANPGELAVMLGDFNDTPDGSAIGEMLKPRADNAPFLIDAHKDLPESERITYLHAPYRGTIDYMLVSPAMAKRQVAKSARVLSDKSVLSGSDHAPISAVFDLSE